MIRLLCFAFRAVFVFRHLLHFAMLVQIQFFQQVRMFWTDLFHSLVFQFFHVGPFIIQQQPSESIENDKRVVKVVAFLGRLLAIERNASSVTPWWNPFWLTSRAETKIQRKTRLPNPYTKQDTMSVELVNVLNLWMSNSVKLYKVRTWSSPNLWMPRFTDFDFTNENYTDFEHMNVELD